MGGNLMSTILTLDELLSLVHEHIGVCLSMYMPTHWKGPETQQNQIRFKNLFREAEKQLAQRDLRPSEIKEFLSPAQELMSDELFWRNQHKGFALFLSPDTFRTYKSPEPFPELVVLSERFHLKPLIEIMSRDVTFLILAVSLRKIRLFECNRWNKKEISLPGVPQSLPEALDIDDFEKKLQLHTGAEDTKLLASRFFQQVDRGLQEFLRDKHDPLIFAGVEYLFPIYREANTYPHLLPTPITGNPDSIGIDELHDLALPIVDGLIKEKLEEALSLYREREGTGLASRDIREIVQAAHHGRVGILFVAQGVQEWGIYERDSGKVHPAEKGQPASEDLLDLAAIATLSHGGTVHVLDPDTMPGGGNIAAIFRY